MDNSNPMEMISKLKNIFGDLPDDRDAAIAKLVDETGLSESDCAVAYDNLIKLLPNL